MDAAAEPLGEEERRAAAAGRYVENARHGVEDEPLAQQEDLSAEVGFWIACSASATTK